jgi:WD40 repeat protein
MSPQASCQISCPTTITKLCITPRHVIATTNPGTVIVLEITCEHHNLENDPHKRIIEAGELWDIDWHDLFLVTGNADGTARLWNIENG